MTFFIDSLSFSTLSTFMIAIQNTLHRQFVEVVNLWTSKRIWVHFTSMTIYPARLKLTGFPDINDIQIIPTYRCSGFLQVDWSSVMLTDHREHVIKLPSERQVLVWRDNDLIHIDSRELNQL